MLRVLVLTANHAEQRPRNERRKAVLHEKHGHLAWAHTHTHTCDVCSKQPAQSCQSTCRKYNQGSQVKPKDAEFEGMKFMEMEKN